jgi:hypothetical protein
MRLKASPEAVALVRERGGNLYLRAKRTRCGGEVLVLLEASSEPDGRAFRRVEAEGIELYLDEALDEPETIELDTGGLGDREVHAYWEGCAHVV